MKLVEVTCVGPEVYQVDVSERNTTTTFQVGATEADVERLGGGKSAEDLIEQSFEYLLERGEALQKLPPSFHLLLIARYHPDYLEDIPARMMSLQ